MWYSEENVSQTNWRSKVLGYQLPGNVKNGENIILNYKIFNSMSHVKTDLFAKSQNTGMVGGHPLKIYRGTCWPKG